MNGDSAGDSVHLFFIYFHLHFIHFFSHTVTSAQNEEYLFHKIKQHHCLVHIYVLKL